MGDPNVLDITEPSQFSMLKDLIGKNDITIVLFWADYCGHCDVYKEKVWNKLKAMPNKKAGLASIHYDQVENSPLSAAKYKGYPSIIRVNKDGTMTEFKDEDGEPSNSISTESANNLEYMKSLVQGRSPTGVQGRSPTGVQGKENRQKPEDTIEDVENEPTPPFSEEAEELRNSTTREDLRNSLRRPATTNDYVLPPNVQGDNDMPTSRKGAVGGSRGGLYEYLESMAVRRTKTTPPSKKKQTRRRKHSINKKKRRSRKN